MHKLTCIMNRKCNFVLLYETNQLHSKGAKSFGSHDNQASVAVRSMRYRCILGNVVLARARQQRAVTASGPVLIWIKYHPGGHRKFVYRHQWQWMSCYVFILFLIQADFFFFFLCVPQIFCALTPCQQCAIAHARSFEGTVVHTYHFWHHTQDYANANCIEWDVLILNNCRNCAVHRNP